MWSHIKRWILTLNHTVSNQISYHKCLVLLRGALVSSTTRWQFRCLPEWSNQSCYDYWCGHLKTRSSRNDTVFHTFMNHSSPNFFNFLWTSRAFGHSCLQSTLGSPIETNHLLDKIKCKRVQDLFDTMYYAYELAGLSFYNYWFEVHKIF